MTTIMSITSLSIFARSVTVKGPEFPDLINERERERGGSEKKDVKVRREQTHLILTDQLYNQRQYGHLLHSEYK